MTDEPQERKRAAREALEEELRKNEEEIARLKALQQQPQSQNIGVETDEETANAMAEAYKLKFRLDDGSYQDGYAEPSLGNDGRMHFTFPSDEKAVEFFSDQAKNNQPFVLVNKENQVLAYSDGKDGKMYHADGAEFNAGDTFKPSADNPSLDDIQERIQENRQSSPTL